MKTVPLLTFVLLAAMACTQPKTSRPGKTSRLSEFALTQWVIGSWHSKSNDGLSYESWDQANDSTLSGQSYSIRNGDTVSLEHLTLIQRRGRVAYVPTVPDQNRGLPIEFELTFISDNKMIFENRDHDFPQTISYERLSADSLIAEIAGVVDGNQRVIQFPMQRLK